MRTGILAGAGAGLAGGIIAAGLLSIMGIKGRQGNVVWAMTLISHTGGSDRLVVGWLLQLAVGIVIGAVFGILFSVSALALRPESAPCWAAIYGIAWWIVGWFVLIPQPLRLTPWTAISDPSSFQIAIAGLLAYLGYGAVFAGVFTWLVRRPPGRESSEMRRR